MDMSQFANKTRQQWDLASQNWDFVAVLAGVAMGFVVILILRLIDGLHSWDWFGASLTAALTASQLTKSRLKSRPSS